MNNFELIKSLLKFENEDQFVFLQLLQRKKEHPELGSNSRVIKSYYINSIESLEKRMDEIELLCKTFNARAYIGINRKSYRKVAYQTLRKVADQLLNEEHRGLKSAYDHCCGISATTNEKEKKWIVDIDDRTLDMHRLLIRLSELKPIGIKYIAEIPTKNGYHLIVKPFDRQEASKLQPEFPQISFKEDIKTDNGTLLYWY